jgi:hypothetical protein
MEADMKKRYVNKRQGPRGLCTFVTMLLLVLAGYTSCNLPNEEKPPQKNDTAAIMTWNMQALFFCVLYGTEYAEYAESAGWTQE